MTRRKLDKELKNIKKSPYFDQSEKSIFVL